MTPTRARTTLLLALLLGLAGDTLLRAEWRLGFSLFLGLGFAATLVVTERGRDRVALALAGMLAALGPALVDSERLLLLDVFAAMVAGALLLWRANGRPLTEARLLDPLRGWVVAAGSGVAGAALLLLGELRDPATPRFGGQRAKLAAAGVLLALPPVIVVSALLAQADPVFRAFVGDWRWLRLDVVVSHAALAAVIAWPAAGWMRGAAVPGGGPLLPDVPRARVAFLGVAPMLWTLTVILAVYLGLQARALFGGAAYVQEVAGMTYAEYARQGFFQLIAVTAIVLGCLLLAEHLLDRDAPRAWAQYRAIGWTLVALLVLLMASALQRMATYVAWYGLSDTRMYATAGMLWVGLAVGWFGLTVLRGRAARFAFGMLVASAGWLAALNATDPDVVVVRVNLARALAGKEFDIPYHVRLSADAVPALVAAAPQLGPARCSDLLHDLHERWDRHLSRDDWREWNLAEQRAEKALAGAGCGGSV